MTALLFIKMLLVGMAGAAIVLAVDRATDKPYAPELQQRAQADPEREQRAQAWDDKADKILEEALANEAEGFTFLARDGRKSARRARRQARKIRRGKA